MMRSIGGVLSALTHLQVLMACSAVAFVDSATLLVSGRHAGTAWLLASGLGTLGLYLLHARGLEHHAADAAHHVPLQHHGHRALR